MRHLVAAGILAACAVATPLAAQEPAAIVIRVQGDVAVVRGGSDVAASVGERLEVGDEIVPSPGSQAILVTRTGGQLVVDQRTTIQEPRSGGNPDIFARALNTLAQAASADATTGGRQGMIRPIPGQPSLVSPRNELKVASTRPTFTWTAVPGQTYDLMLRPLGGGRPVVFEVGTDTTWTLPGDADELEMGETYEWTLFVGGRRGGRAVQPAQRFRVIDLVESVEMEDYLEDISVFGLDPRGDGLFLTVVAYRDMGLLYDASEALESVEEDSGLSWELYRLKGEILAELGREADAREAFDRADELTP